MFAAGGGALSGREASKLQKAADEQNKSSFGLAFMTDATDTERERGVTVDVGAAKLIDMEKFQLALLDAPGHKVTRNNVNWPKKSYAKNAHRESFGCWNIVMFMLSVRT